MGVKLYYYPYSRAAGVVWMLEEVGCDYELEFVDTRAGEQKSDAILAINPMGKLPILRDGDAVVTESAAIGLYLADRYAPGRLAPALDSPARGTYYRWLCFSPSVIEPGLIARAGGWTYKEGLAGWGNYQAMLATMEAAIGDDGFLLGDDFSMADIVFGGTIRYMLQVQMLEPRERFQAYVARLGERPALQKADALNARMVEEHGLGG